MKIHALHGNLGSAADWSSIGWDAVEAADLWGGADLALWDWAFEFCRGVDPEEDNLLLGYSLGGRLALHVLAAGAGLWRGAVILSAHPGLPCPEDRLARRSEDAVWAKWAREMPWEEFLEKWNGRGVLAGEPVPEAQGDLEPRREAIARAFETWSLGTQEDLRERLGRVEIPVLWITGIEDGRFTGLGAEMADRMPRGRHIAIAGCGHRVHFDNPGEVARRIAQEFGSSPSTGLSAG